VPPQFATIPLEHPSFARGCDRGTDCGSAPPYAAGSAYDRYAMMTGPVFSTAGPSLCERPLVNFSRIKGSPLRWWGRPSALKSERPLLLLQLPCPFSDSAAAAGRGEQKNRIAALIRVTRAQKRAPAAREHRGLQYRRIPHGQEWPREAQLGWAMLS